RTPRPPRVGRVPRVPRVPRVARVDLDLEDLTDSLENMMDGLGRSIEMSLSSIDGLKVPGIRIHKGRRRTKKRKEQLAMIESIAPERVAQIVAPLGNEERLKILDYLKSGGKGFNEIEEFTGKTGSSLTHHLNPLIDAGYVVKGEVRGTYYVTVEGRLAYRLAQWLTYRIENQRKQTGNNGEVSVEFDDDESVVIVEDEDATESARAHLEELAEELEEQRGELEEQREELEEQMEDLDVSEEDDDDTDDLDDLDWED
ncbi:MAG: ArsR/SmtB family transcription factor, partial [Candidatus Thorarchaeota archaeon]